MSLFAILRFCALWACLCAMLLLPGAVLASSAEVWAGGSLVLVREELRAMADINAFLESGQTPLTLAAKNNTPDVVKAILEKGAKADQPNRLGMTPLMMAAEYNARPGVIQALVDGGADIDARHAKSNKTAFMIAAEKTSNPAVVGVFMDNNADPRLTDAKGRTVLFYAKGNMAVRNDTMFATLTDYADPGSGLYDPARGKKDPRPAQAPSTAGTAGTAPPPGQSQPVPQTEVRPETAAQGTPGHQAGPPQDSAVRPDSQEPANGASGAAVEEKEEPPFTYALIASVAGTKAAKALESKLGSAMEVALGAFFLAVFGLLSKPFKYLYSLVSGKRSTT